MKKIKIDSFEKVNHKIRDEMSSKPYIAFFEVGKDENKIVEVKLTMSTVDMLELRTPYIFYSVKNAKTIGRVLSKKENCQNSGSTTR